MMPFYANYGYHPSSGTIPTATNILSTSSVGYGHWMKAVVEKCKKELAKSRERMKNMRTDLASNLPPSSQAI
jgi:hypothetical protein